MSTCEVELSQVILDLAAGPFGSNLKVSCFVEDGFPIIDGANLKGFRVTDNVTKFVTEEKARSLARSIAKRNDVVVTISGTVGQIAYIPMDSKYSEYLCSQRQFRVTFDETKAYVPYIVFYFHTYEGRQKILAFANQTGVPALSQPLKNFKKIRMVLPDLDTQKAIAGVIELLNSKIENNNHINDNLLQQLQAIYQAKFGKNTVAPDMLGRLSDICYYSQRRIAVADLSLETYYSTENMLPEKAGAVIASSLPSTAQAVGCIPGDVLVSNIRPYFKKILYCSASCGCSNDVLCFEPSNAELSAFLFSTLFDDRFFDYMVAGSKGTKMPRGDKQQIMAYPIVVPATDELSAFNEIACPILAKVETMKGENKRLSELRDTLLPRLISGEIDVSEVVT